MRAVTSSVFSTAVPEQWFGTAAVLHLKPVPRFLERRCQVMANVSVRVIAVWGEWEMYSWVGMASLELEGGGWRGGGITMGPDLLGIVWKLVWQRFGWGFLQCIHQKVVLLGQKPKDFIYLFTEEFWNTPGASTPAALQLPFLSSVLLVVVVYECCYHLSGQVNHAVSKFLLLYMFFPSWLEQCGDTEIVLADSLGRCL